MKVSTSRLRNTATALLVVGCLLPFILLAQSGSGIGAAAKALIAEARGVLRKWSPIVDRLQDEVKDAAVEKVEEWTVDNIKELLSRKRRPYGYVEALEDTNAFISRVRRDISNSPQWSTVSTEDISDPATCRASANRFRRDLERARAELAESSQLPARLEEISRNLGKAEQVRQEFLRTSLGAAIVDSTPFSGGALYEEYLDLLSMDVAFNPSDSDQSTFRGTAYRADLAKAELEGVLVERKVSLDTVEANARGLGILDGSVCSDVQVSCSKVRADVEKRRDDAIRRAVAQTSSGSVGFFCRTDVISVYGPQCADAMIQALSCAETDAVQALAGSCADQRRYLREPSACDTNMAAARKTCDSTRPERPLIGATLPGSWRSVAICAIDMQRRSDQP